MHVFVTLMDMVDYNSFKNIDPILNMKPPILIFHFNCTCLTYIHFATCVQCNDVLKVQMGKKEEK